MDTYNDKPKRTIDQANLWYSQYNQGWVTCVWVVQRFDSYSGSKTYTKEKVVHPSYKDAVEYLSKNYVGGKS